MKPDPNVIFEGSIPENYDRYWGPAFFEPFAKDIVARLTGEQPRNVLELACRTGIGQDILGVWRIWCPLRSSRHVFVTDTTGSISKLVRVGDVDLVIGETRDAYVWIVRAHERDAVEAIAIDGDRRGYGKIVFAA